MRCLYLTLLTGLLFTSSLSAHPVPKDNHDRMLVVRLKPDAVVVDYRLELDETTAARELPQDELKGITTRKALHDTISRYFSEILAENLDAQLDGTALRFRCVKRSYEVTDHIRCDFRFEAPWSPKPDTEHRFQFRESNWELDDFSRLAVRLMIHSNLKVLSAEAPSEALIGRPGADRKSGDGEKLRLARATFRVAVTDPPAAYKPALPPDPLPARPGPESQGLETDNNAAITRPPPGETVGWDKPYQEKTAQPEEPAQTPSHNLLDLLLDTRWGVGMLLLLALLFGAAHALTPGHGKTLVAAYLIGERGTVWHALLLGVVVTVTHTFAVLVLAAVLPLFFPRAVPADVQRILGQVGGLLIAGLGIWLLWRRLLGQADHIHLGGGHHHHHHHHDHDHHHEPSISEGQAVGWWGLVLLGINGGIVPCWDAIAMLGFAISAQRLWLGLPLLLAFSAGLAGVLIVIGIGVVYARDIASRWWGGQGNRWQPLIRALPLISAILVTVLGLWLCYGSSHSASGH